MEFASLCHGTVSMHSSMHVKSLMIDKKLWILGNTNWTRNSVQNNHEMSVLMYCGTDTIAEFEKQLEMWLAITKDFHVDLLDSAKRTILAQSASQSSESRPVPTAAARIAQPSPSRSSGMSKRMEAQFSIGLGTKKTWDC